MKIIFVNKNIHPKLIINVIETKDNIKIIIMKHLFLLAFV